MMNKLRPKDCYFPYHTWGVPTVGLEPTSCSRVYTRGNRGVTILCVCQFRHVGTLISQAIGSFREVPVFSRSLSQFRVWQLLCLHELQECIAKQKLIMTIVKTVLQLIKVGVQMLCAQLVIRPDHSAL